MAVDKKKLKQLSESIIVETQPIMTDIVNESSTDRDKHVFDIIATLIEECIGQIDEKNVDDSGPKKKLVFHLKEARKIALSKV